MQEELQATLDVEHVERFGQAPSAPRSAVRPRMGWDRLNVVSSVAGGVNTLTKGHREVT